MALEDLEAILQMHLGLKIGISHICWLGQKQQNHQQVYGFGTLKLDGQLFTHYYLQQVGSMFNWLSGTKG